MTGTVLQRQLTGSSVALYGLDEIGLLTEKGALLWLLLSQTLELLARVHRVPRS